MHPRAACHVNRARCGHTFRHTVVQMLFLTGSSFETIAKWIGHSSPQVTSAIYGRLSHRDAEASLGNVPFLAPRNPDVVSEWAGLAEFRPGFRLASGNPPPAFPLPLFGAGVVGRSADQADEAGPGGPRHTGDPCRAGEPCAQVNGFADGGVRDLPSRASPATGGGHQREYPPGVAPPRGGAAPEPVAAAAGIAAVPTQPAAHCALTVFSFFSKKKAEVMALAVAGGTPDSSQSNEKEVIHLFEFFNRGQM